LELTSSFAPAEDLADFGLDAIYVVTDATPPAPVPRLVSIGPGGQPGAIRMQWDGAGRVFQLEKASEVTGPFRPVSPLVPGLGWTDYGETLTNSRAFYRLRQW